MAENTDVTMVALKGHPGYGYNGQAQLLFVSEGDTFTTTAAKAERAIAKGLAVVKPAKLKAPAPTVASVEPVAAKPAPVKAPAKVDGRTKAGKAAKARHK